MAKIIAGNWKMNYTENEMTKFFKDFIKQLPKKHKTLVIIAPPFTSLGKAHTKTKGTGVELAAQNMFFEDSGPYTGEISPGMVKEFAKYVIIGHSERRHIFGERDSEIRLKVAKALSHGLTPILAVGETKMDREEAAHKSVVASQLAEDLADLAASDLAEIIIAYEPVWAIGTGLACDPNEAVTMVRHIRQSINELFRSHAAEKIPVLYGGSVDADNIGNYITQTEINGALVGGASLRAEDFAKIVAVAERA